jgi:hypothetical protein
MKRRNHFRRFLSFGPLIILAFFLVFSVFLFASSAYATTDDKNGGPPWTIYFNPGVRFGTDNRTLYILDFLIPLYRDDKSILFAEPRYTPNDQDGWEVNLGLGYRRLLFDDRLMLGVNGFYDKRKTPWNTREGNKGSSLRLTLIGSYDILLSWLAL